MPTQKVCVLQTVYFLLLVSFFVDMNIFFEPQSCSKQQGSRLIQPCIEEIDVSIDSSQLLVVTTCNQLNPWLITKMQPAEVFSMVITSVIAFLDVHLNWLNWFDFLILEGGLLVILIDCMIFLPPFLDVTRMSMSTVSFHAQLHSGILCLQNAFL